MCRPVDGSREAACPGGHIGPPLHNAGNVPEITESGVENEHFPSGAGRSPPPTGGAEQGGLRRGAPGVWLPPVKFRNGIWGVSHGHPALRVQRRWYPAKGRCGHRPLRKGEKVSSTTRASGAQRSVCASGCEEMSGNCGRDHPQRGHQPRTIPQSPSGRQLPLHKGAFGDGGCGLPRRFAPRNDSPDPLSFRGGPTGRRGNPFLFTMDGGSGRRVVGPYGWLREAPRDCRGSA